jgi:hypothetical protein
MSAVRSSASQSSASLMMVRGRITIDGAVRIVGYRIEDAVTS